MRDERWSNWSINFGGVGWQTKSVRCRAGRVMHGLNRAETRHFQARTPRGTQHQRLCGAHRLIVVAVLLYCGVRTPSWHAGLPEQLSVRSVICSVLSWLQLRMMSSKLEVVWTPCTRTMVYLPRTPALS